MVSDGKMNRKMPFDVFYKTKDLFERYKKMMQKSWGKYLVVIWQMGRMVLCTYLLVFGRVNVYRVFYKHQ